MLHGGRRLGAEVAVQHARDVPLVGPEGLLEPRAQLGHHLLGGRARGAASTSREAFSRSARSTSTLAPGLLAVQHAGADLDRVGDHARRVLARLDRAAHQLGGDRVVDDDVLDDQAADERVDAGRAEWGGGLHEQRREATARQRTSKPLQALGLLARSTSSASTCAWPGPARVNSTSAATASGGPSKTASTEPSAQLRTQPGDAAPLRLAARAVAEEDALDAPGGADPAADG